VAGPTSLADFYGDYPTIEGAFRAALAESLDPRGPDLLYDLVAAMELPPASVAADVGCGEGRHSLVLAERFGFDVVGVDPVPRNLEVAERAAGGRARFVQGVAEALPFDDATVDLVWCRDVLVHVAALERAYAEFARVLRAGGRVLVYQVFRTERLEPREAEWLWRTVGIAPTSTDPARADAAIAASGLRLDERIEIGTEWSEWAGEHTELLGERLLHAARLLRDPERYVATFGAAAFEIMLADCLWHVYLAIGKLDRKAYLLTRG